MDNVNTEGKMKLNVSVISEEPHRFLVFVNPDDNVAALKKVIATYYARMYPEAPSLEMPTHLKCSESFDVADFYNVKDAFGEDREVLVQVKQHMSPYRVFSNNRKRKFCFQSPSDSHFVRPVIDSSPHLVPADYASATPSEIASSNLPNHPPSVISTPVSSNNGRPIKAAKSKKSVGLNGTNAHTSTNDNKDIEFSVPKLAPKVEEGEAATAIKTAKRKKKRNKKKHANKKTEDGTSAMETVEEAPVSVQSAMEAEAAKIATTNMDQRTKTELEKLNADQVGKMAKEAKKAEAAATVAKEKRKAELKAEKKEEAEDESLMVEAEKSKARAEGVMAKLARLKAEVDSLKAQEERMKADKERMEQEQKHPSARRKVALKAKAAWDAVNEIANEEYRKAYEDLEEGRRRIRMPDVQKIAQDEMDQNKAENPPEEQEPQEACPDQENEAIRLHDANSATRDTQGEPTTESSKEENGNDCGTQGETLSDVNSMNVDKFMLNDAVSKYAIEDEPVHAVEPNEHTSDIQEAKNALEVQKVQDQQNAQERDAVEAIPATASGIRVLDAESTDREECQDEDEDWSEEDSSNEESSDEDNEPDELPPSFQVPSLPIAQSSAHNASPPIVSSSYPSLQQLVKDIQINGAYTGIMTSTGFVHTFSDRFREDPIEEVVKNPQESDSAESDEEESDSDNNVVDSSDDEKKSAKTCVKIEGQRRKSGLEQLARAVTKRKNALK